MINLMRFFDNPFTDKNISNSELQNFAEDHLAKVTAANPGGAHDALLADTSAAYIGYFGEVANASLRMALQKAATQTMNHRWAEFVKWMTGKGEARIKDRTEKPSAVYSEFFPAGPSEYHNMTKAEGRVLAERVKTSAATHAALLGADFKAKVDELADGYIAAREAQLERKGDHTGTRSNRDEAKAALQVRLFDNLLLFAAATKDPEKCAFYFNQSLLENAVSKPAAVPEPATA